MKKVIVFVNEKELYDDNVIYPTSGRYGMYATIGRLNYSQKQMENKGYQLKYLTQDEIRAINQKCAPARKAVQDGFYAQKMAERTKQVAICLKSKPVDVINHVAHLSDAMKEAYAGCGKGTAYTKNGKLVAFHYGSDAPNNAPSGCEVYYPVSMSGCAVCFY